MKKISPLLISVNVGAAIALALLFVAKYISGIVNVDLYGINAATK